jgi:hypothetical protein
MFRKIKNAIVNFFDKYFFNAKWKCNVCGKEIFKGGFDRITIVNKDLFFARRDGEKGYWYNAKGERIGTEDDVTAFAASCDYVVMEKDDEYLLVNEKGEKVLRPKEGSEVKLLVDEEMYLNEEGERCIREKKGSKVVLLPEEEICLNEKGEMMIKKKGLPFEGEDGVILLPDEEIYINEIKNQ